MDFVEKLEQAQENEFSQIFSLVKQAVEETLQARRAGLMLGLAELGASPSGFVGAYYPLDTNIIVLNKTALEFVRQQKPSIMKPFVFHLLLHEYLHSLGIYDEQQTRQATRFVSRKTFGEGHAVTELSEDMRKHFPKISYGVPGDQTGEIELVKQFDEESRKYYS